MDVDEGTTRDNESERGHGTVSMQCCYWVSTVVMLAMHAVLRIIYFPHSPSSFMLSIIAKCMYVPIARGEVLITLKTVNLPMTQCIEIS